MSKEFKSKLPSIPLDPHFPEEKPITTLPAQIDANIKAAPQRGEPIFPQGNESKKGLSLPIEKSMPVRSEIENQGTKEPRKVESKETIKLDTNKDSYKPNYEAREEERTIQINLEIYEDQLEALNELIYRKSKKGRRTLTKKQFGIDAFDEHLSREFKKLD